MAFEIAYFQQVEGGYPHALNGATNAILNDETVFYMDLGKSAGYADMMLDDITEFSSISDTTEITGLEIVIEDAGYLGINGGSTIDIEIFNSQDGGYSNTITTTFTNHHESSPSHISVGGSTEMWGKNWSLSDLTNSDFRVHVDNPTEPSGVTIALAGTFWYLKVHYIVDIIAAPYLQLSSGEIQLHSGEIQII